MNLIRLSKTRAFMPVFAGVAILFTASGFLLAEDPKHVPTDEAMSAVISKAPPEYPAIAKQMKISGSVEVQATIDEEGSVTEVTAVNGNPILAKAAIDAIKRWKFKPFKEDGKPVKAISNFTIGFKGV